MVHHYNFFAKTISLLALLSEEQQKCSHFYADLTAAIRPINASCHYPVKSASFYYLTSIALDLLL